MEGIFLSAYLDKNIQTVILVLITGGKLRVILAHIYDSNICKPTLLVFKKNLSQYVILGTLFLHNIMLLLTTVNLQAIYGTYNNPIIFEL